MKHFIRTCIALILCLTLCLGCLCAAAEEGATLLEQGNFTCPTADGGVFTLADHAGEVVFINFWATWCGPCCYELPGIQQLADHYADAEDVTILTVNCAERTGVVQKFMADNGYTFAVACDTDGEVGYLYGVEAIPTTVIFGKDGGIAGAWVGLVADVEEVCRHYVDFIEGIR